MRNEPPLHLSPAPCRCRRLNPRTRDRAGWPVPTALIALLIIPMAAGTLRVLEVAGGPQVLPDNPRITDSPAPLVIHVVAAGVFALVGAFQFPLGYAAVTATGTAARARVLVVAGLLVAGSGLWMTLFYSDAPVELRCGRSACLLGQRPQPASSSGSPPSAAATSPHTAPG